MQIEVHAFSIGEISLFFSHFFFSWYGEKDIQMKIFFINISFPYTRLTLILFSELLQCLVFLKNNQLKITLIPKRCILR